VLWSPIAGDGVLLCRSHAF